MCLAKIAETELIHTRVRILNARCKTYIGITGIVVDETKNTFLIKDERVNKLKIVPKKNLLFEFTLEDNTKVEIDGSKLMHRHEDRLKKLWKYLK